MKHGLKQRKLNRTSSHRLSLLKNLSISLIKHETITTTTEKAKELRLKYNVTGFPVVNNKQEVVGIVTNRDIRFVEDISTPVKNIMTTNNLAIVNHPIDTKAAKKIEAKTIVATTVTT